MSSAILTCIKDWLKLEIHQLEEGGAYYAAVEDTQNGDKLDRYDLSLLSNGDQTVVIDATELARDSISEAQRLLEKHGFTVFFSANQYVRDDTTVKRAPGRPRTGNTRAFTVRPGFTAIEWQQLAEAAGGEPKIAEYVRAAALAALATNK